ncbi:MFS transporter [Pseudoflavitalea sp. G-6-1-2]|uniref:MFS transporter n=1 Tax=Pseudoflavitalea sp. G-6-1-2 TaxID=2728841 RepID=UPI00146B18D8|nr:MFS transporter [Pseudoflavitalea sp. G-6-1-2]NML22017.1 MFS transporter [Pseudoflavitalea sp. G-6-1-2]
MSGKQHSRWLMLLVILTAPLLYVIDIFIINIAIPTIKSTLGGTQAEMQLVIAGYLLGSACFLIIGARAGDFLGRKKVFFMGMLAFTITSCICGFAQTMLQLNIARFLQGVSSAFMVTQSIALIQELFPESKLRAKAIGWYGITLSIAAIIGQILGGYLAETNTAIPGWRLIFFINVPAGILSLWAIRTLLPETKTIRDIQFDYSGAVLLMAGLGSFIYAITEGREYGWPIWSIVLLAAGGIIIVYFFFNQKRKTAKNKQPLMNTALFRRKEFLLGLLAVLFHFMFHTAYLLMMAVYLQSGAGISALECGLYFIPHALLFMVSSAIASKLLPLFGKKVLLAGLLIIFISFILQMQLFSGESQPLLNMLLIGVYGLGNGLVLPFLLNIVLDSIPGRYAGISAGIFSTFQQIASALGISIIGGVFYDAIGEYTKQEYKHALDKGLGVSLICLLIVVLMLRLLPASTEQNRSTEVISFE